jgi:signal transduction histidine kinase
MTLTKTKVILLMLIGALTAASPNILRIVAMILLLIYIIKYREEKGPMRMAAFVAVGYSVALFPSPWHALACGIMLYLIYKRWEDAGFLGLLGGFSMISAYAFYEYAGYRLGWFFGERLFYIDYATAVILGYGLFYTGVAVTAISTFLIFMKVAEETVKAREAEEQMLKRLAPKPQKEMAEEGRVAAEEEEEKKEVAAREGKKKEEKAVEEPAEVKKVRVRLPRSVEI